MRPTLPGRPADPALAPTPFHGLVFRLIASLALLGLFAGGAAASDTGFVYALQQVNGGANQIYGFFLDPATGTLTLLPGFPVASGGLGGSAFLFGHMAYVNGRLYVANEGSATLSAFIVNQATGALTALPFSPITIGGGIDPACVAVHPSGSPVVVGGSGLLASFVVTATTATPATGNPFTTHASPFSCAFNAGGNYFYAGGLSDTTFAGLAVSRATGVLNPLSGSPFSSGANFPVAYAIDSAGRLFSANFLGGLRVFTTSAGIPTGVAANPFPSGLSTATHGILHPAGFYLVADRSANQVGVYQIGGSGSATTLSAVSGSPFATGGLSPHALALTPDGGLLLAANASTRNLTVFRVNPSTGSLTSLGVQAFNAIGTSGIVTGLAFAPNVAGFVYALQQVDGGANQIHGFRFDPIAHVLTPLAGFPVTSGGTGTFGPFSEQMAFANGRLYVANEGSSTLSAFAVNPTSGALTALPFSPIPLGGVIPVCVAVHPTGSPVVVGGGGQLASFAVTATTAMEAAGSPFATTGTSPFSCAFSRDGSYLHAGGTTGAAIAGFAVAQSTGVLTPLAGSPFSSGAGNPLAYTTDSAGRLFSSNFSAGQVRAFTTSAGLPTGVTGNPFLSGLTQGVHGVLHPAGFYLVADRSANKVGVYQISGSGSATTLSAVSGSPFASGGIFSDALALTPDGGLLLGANGSSRNLTLFSVDANTGGLTSLDTQAANTLGAAGIITGLVFASHVDTVPYTNTTAGGPTWNRPTQGNPPVPPLSSIGTAVPYGVTPFTVSVSGPYLFQSKATNPANWDNFTFLYQKSFDPTQPFTNVIIGNDDNPTVGLSGFSANLIAGTPYFFVVTGFGNTSFGAWSTTISGPGIAGPSFTDNPLVPNVTAIKALHLLELHARIDAVRARYSLPAISWSTVTAATTLIQAAHIAEMRAALQDAYAAAELTPPTYSTSAGIGVPIVVADIAELRAAVASIE